MPGKTEEMKKSCLSRCGLSGKKNERSISVFRVLVCLSLFVAAVVCGTVSYLVLRASEHRNYRNQYDAATRQMKRSVENMLNKYHFAADQLALVANIKYPNSSSWPFVGIHDFHLLDQSIIDVTGSASGNSILPIVSTEQLPAFNTYAKDFLAGEEWLSEYPQLHDIYDLGVWRLVNRFPIEITDGVPLDFEARDLIVPIINPPKAIAEAGFLLGDAHSQEDFGVTMDDILSCTEQGHTECASMSNYLIDSVYEGAPDTNIYRPIFSVDSTGGNKSVLGFSTVGFSWKQELQRLIIDEDISGLEVVLSSFEQPADMVSRTFTFEFKDGDAVYAGKGDKHDDDYSSMAVNVPLSLIGSKTDTSYTYSLTIYPTSEYENSFYTQTPLFTALGFVGMILFTSVIFLLYDYLVNENVKWKDQVLRMKRDFVRFISHEIRTPLNTVSVGLQLIYEGLLAQQAGEEVTATDMLELATDVQSSTGTAVTVLNDLLNFDKLQSGELQIAHEPVHVWETVVTVVRSFKIPAMQKNISVELQFENNVDEEVSCIDLVVMGDKFKICHIIRNMMSNALKFTGDGGSIVAKVAWAVVPVVEEEESKSSALIRLSSSSILPEEKFACKTSHLTISVVDSGYGLTAEQIGMLFRDGVQFNPNELQAGQGSGLGLYLSQAIAALHGGKMWATSEGENKGATFNVQFPVEVGVATLLPRLVSNESSSSKDGRIASGDSMQMRTRRHADSSPHVVCSSRESVTESRERIRSLHQEDDSKASPTVLCGGMILVVDDAASNRKIVCHMLRKRGYDCEEAKDGREAITAIEEKCNPEYFACVLMDFEMPGMNGPDATAALRARGYRVPIYGLTGNVMVEDVEHFLRSGADNVLAKPFQISEFNTFMLESKV